MVVLPGVRLAALGLLIGFVGALALTRLMQGMLFGTEPRDPVTFVVVSAFLAAIAAVASYLRLAVRRASTLHSRLRPSKRTTSGRFHKYANVIIVISRALRFSANPAWR
jgi:hypothetical protein